MRCNLSKCGLATAIIANLWMMCPAKGDTIPLSLSTVGSVQLRVLSPYTLELEMINTKAPDPAVVLNWNLVDAIR